MLASQLPPQARVRIVMIGPEWSAARQLRLSKSARLEVFPGLYSEATVEALGGPPSALICFNCDIYHCHWRPALLYMLGLGRPVALTFFEEFELEETAKLLRDRATFSAQQLALATCSDMSAGMFSKSDEKWRTAAQAPLPPALLALASSWQPEQLTFMQPPGPNPFAEKVPAPERLGVSRMAARMVQKQNSHLLAVQMRRPPSPSLQRPRPSDPGWATWDGPRPGLAQAIGQLGGGLGFSLGLVVGGSVVVLVLVARRLFG